MLLDHVGRVFLVEGDQALVEALLGGEHRLDAKEHVEIAKLRDVAAHHCDAHGERDGEQQADRPPQPGPEDRRGDDGDGRKSRRAPIEIGLDEVEERDLDGEEYPERP